MLGRGEFAETLQEPVHLADAVAERAQMLRHRLARRSELFGYQLQVQHHVVQRVLAFMRKADGDPLEQEGPIRRAGASAFVVRSRDPLHWLSHAALFSKAHSTQKRSRRN